MLVRAQTIHNSHRRGMVAVYVAISLLPILGVVALVIDIGLFRVRRQHVQAATDAASLAAAVELFHNSEGLNSAVSDPLGMARAAALKNLKANGYTSENSEIAINIPPKQSRSGFDGKLGYAEVIINFKQQRYFSAIFGSEDILIGGRAIARGGDRSASIGVIALDRHEDRAFRVNGNGEIEVRGGSIIVNSDSDEALSMTGNAEVEADSHEITGGFSTSGNSSLIGPAHTGVPPIADPLRHLPEPNPAHFPVRATSQTRVNGNKSVVLQPGVYEGGIKISGNGSAELLPGIYVMRGGGFEFSGNGDAIANGVMIYNMSDGGGDGVKITGNGSFTLTPPLSGPYRGIGIFQQRSLAERLQISGNGGLQIAGMVYAPAAEVAITGNGSSDVFGGAIIANSLPVSGNGRILVDTESTPSVTPEIPLLVE